MTKMNTTKRRRRKKKKKKLEERKQMRLNDGESKEQKFLQHHQKLPLARMRTPTVKIKTRKIGLMAIGLTWCAVTTNFKKTTTPKK